MPITLRRNLKTVSHEFTVKLQPIIFRKEFEIHGVNIERHVYEDKCPDPGDESDYTTFNARIKTMSLTAKGKPDKREEPSWYGGGNFSYVFGHAMVQLLDDEQRALFGDHFRESGICINARLDFLGDRGLTAEQIEKIRADVEKRFDADVEEAKQIIEQNAI
jgi:hypothetical protein